MALVKVVMLTSMAGQGLTLLCDDVYETDEAEAARFIEHRAAREYDAELDKNKPVKRKPDVEAELPDGHYQNDKPKGKPKGKRSVETVETDVDSEDPAVESLEEDSASVEPAEVKPTARRRR